MNPDPLEQRIVKRRRERGNGDRQRRGSLLSELAGTSVGSEVERINRNVHALTRFAGHVGRLIQYARDRRDRDTGAFRDIVDRDLWFVVGHHPKYGVSAYLSPRAFCDQKPDAPDMARVQLESVRKVYENGFVAVEGADIDIRDGEFVVLVGPSGCGKSTTLRMIAGLETISEGTLRIGDTVVNDLPPKDRDIAMVFQNYALYPHMTVFDNMAFGLKLRKYAKADIKARVEEAAEILGITPILDRKPKQLSGGQRQRVAVGRAIVRKPQVFLFDEPLSNLDAKLRVQMRTEISKLHRTLQATMVYVTHDQVEAMTMGDRIVVMKDGVVQQIDAPLNLYNEPANQFVAGFIGSPSMNFVTGQVEGKNGSRRFVADAGFGLDLARSVPDVLGTGQRVTLGIRPENISVATPDSATAIAMTLDVVEPMGNEIVAYASAGGQHIVARLPPQELPEPGNPVGLDFDRSQLRYFDADSGAVIS